MNSSLSNDPRDFTGSNAVSPHFMHLNLRSLKIWGLSKSDAWKICSNS